MSLIILIKQNWKITKKRYLIRGKYFVYPDSILMIYTNYDNDNYEIPLGLQLYLKKYKTKKEEKAIIIHK